MHAIGDAALLQSANYDVLDLVLNDRVPIANLGLWDYRGKIWDYGITPWFEIGITEIMSEFGIMGLHFEPRLCSKFELRAISVCIK